jgi:intracellular sulfur oxidation DsrE/DsrF family protein
MKVLVAGVVLIALCVVASAQEQFPVIRDAGGYWPLPDALVQPDKGHEYKAIFDATHAADDPTGFVPGLESAAALVNGLAAGGVPPANRKIAVILYGPAVYAVLDNVSYRQKYGTDNPNLKLIEQLRKAGVELYVCSQLLKAKKIERTRVAPDVAVATDAFILLVSYQNRGYARLSE